MYNKWLGLGLGLPLFLSFLVVQDYYSVTSDMPTDIMLSVASENLETKMNSIVEEQHRVSLIKPLHIWLSRWVGLKIKIKKLKINVRVS